MPRPRTYGSKRSVTSSGAAAIFGSERSTTTSSTVVPGNSTFRTDAINELTTKLGKTTLEGNTSEYDADAQAGCISILPGLEPLAAAILADHDRKLCIDDWCSVLPHGSTITKIAEASYAEVYRVKTISGSSIVKVMQLRVPSDEASLEIETANEVANVVSEIRIMNALTEVPGFVTFKATFVVQGPPPKPIVNAYHEYLSNRLYLSINDEDERSYFPDPATAYTGESTFLVLELGDAGNVMESVLVNDISLVWDLFLGVVMALSRAELTNEFEVSFLPSFIKYILLSSARFHPSFHFPRHPVIVPSRLTYS
jgi:serine/threonine-protein kinase haspin